MIRSELYKVFIKQNLILFLFVFLFLNAAYHIVTGYDTTTVIRNSESYYTSFFDKYEGKITTEKTTQIKEEYKKLEKDTVNMLSNKLEKQAFESFYHVYLYESDSGSGYLTDTRGWESILCHDNINYLLAVFVVLLGVMLFSVEYENEMNIMIVSTCGRNRLTGCKIFIGIAGAIISASLFQIVHIMYLVSTIGLHHADYPLNTIEFYENSRYGISLGTALLFKFIVTILGCMLLVSFAMLMTVLLKRREICMVLAVLLVILPRMIFSNSSILYRIPWITPLLSANGFFWPDRYTHQIIDNQLKKVIVFQAIKTKTMLIVLSMDIFLIVLSSYIVFGKFSNHRKSKYIKMTSKILPCLLICFCLTGCGEISEDKEVIIDGTLNAQINMTIGGNMYYIDQNENLVYCEDAKNNIIAITRNIIPLQQRITNIFVDAHYCYYLLEDDNSSNIIVRSVDLESFEDKLVYSAGSDNTEDFYGLRKDESNDADEILKNIATVNWFIVTDKVIYYQKNSAIYKCSKISGKQEIIAEAVSDDEVQYLKGVLHYTDAHGKKTSYNESAK